MFAFLSTFFVLFLVSFTLNSALVATGAEPPDPDPEAGDDSILPQEMPKTGERQLNGRRKRGAIYARFSTKFQESLEDQIRACQDWCQNNGVDVDPNMVFVDAAKSGKKSRRDGFDRLKEVMATGKIDVLVTFTTNRLFRSAYKARQFIEEKAIDQNIRVVCIRSNVDTADTRAWRLLHSVHAMADEMMLDSTAEAVRNAHVGALIEKLVAGRITFGYGGEEIPGRFTRQRRPKRRIVIDPVTGEWVKKIFTWYDAEGLSITQIVIRLIEESAPRPTGCERWTEQLVRRILSNARFIGRWAYGRFRSKWMNSKDYAKQELQENPLTEKFFPELRLISDELFLRVQAKLAGRNCRAGRPTRSGVRRPRILNGILRCGVHDRPLNRGANEFYCPECRRSRDKNRLYSKLPAELALNELCKSLAAMITADKSLIERVIAAFQAQVATLQRPDPRILDELKKRKERLTARINFVQDNPGESVEDLTESAKILKQLRGERAKLEAEIAQLSVLFSRVIHVPSEGDVQNVIDNMVNVLTSAAIREKSADAEILRRVIEEITGGTIICSQQGESRARHGWVRGSFRPQFVSAVGGESGGGTESENAPVVEIDFVRATEADPLADEVKGHYDEGLPIRLIAKKISKPVTLVRNALDYWFRSRGLKREDGRSRRSKLAVKHVDPPIYQRVADEVKKLADDGLLFQQIARRLDLDRNTVTQAWKFWHSSRGLEASKGQQRRRMLVIKSEKPYRRRADVGGQQERPAA